MSAGLGDIPVHVPRVDHVAGLRAKTAVPLPVPLCPAIAHHPLTTNNLLAFPSCLILKPPPPRHPISN